MATKQEKSWCLIDLTAKEHETETLVQTDELEVTRIMLSPGTEHPPYSAEGDVLMTCISGRVRVWLSDDFCELSPGHLLHIPAHEPHALDAHVESVVLIVNVGQGEPRQHPVEEEAIYRKQHSDDVVQHASEESFPASDPPSWTETTS